MERKLLILIITAAVFGVIALTIAIAVPVALKSKDSDEMTPIKTAKAWMKETPLIDGHNDLPWQFKNNIDNQISTIDFNKRPSWDPAHTDITRLRKGLVGAQFWAAYITCKSQYKDSLRHVLDQIDVIKRLCDLYPETFEFVTSSQGIKDAFENGKIGSLIGVEGGHSLDSQMAVLRMLYELGARYITVTHSCNTPWADNWLVDKPEGEPEFDGLSEYGEKVIREMNRLGMLVDLSHVSKATMEDILNIPDVPPVIFSHTSAFAICASFRNVQDDVLQKVKENGGVVMVNFYTQYINCPPGNKTDDPATATLGQVADHIEHIKNVCGIECVGLGSDYDGVGTLPQDLEDVSTFPNLIEELISRGWNESETKALLGNNLLRVFEQVEQFAAKHKSDKPDETTIPKNDTVNDECRTVVFDPDE